MYRYEQNNIYPGSPGWSPYDFLLLRANAATTFLGDTYAQEYQSFSLMKLQKITHKL